MPSGTVRGAQATVAGLLLLALLLLSAAAGASVAAVAGDQHHRVTAAGHAIAAACASVPAASNDGCCDHGLPCCGGGGCATHPCCKPALSLDLPGPLRLAPAFLSGCDCLPGGITTGPSAPPPRTVV
jgi:hypothetical protein